MVSGALITNADMLGRTQQKPQLPQKRYISYKERSHCELRRCGMQLADALISPTHYMTAFLRERAWRLPKTSLVIPNVLPPAAPGQPALKASHLHLEDTLIPCVSGFIYA